MKIRSVNYAAGGTGIELVAETEIEYMVLRQIFEHGEMSRGDGNTKAPNGGSTGFYLHAQKGFFNLSKGD